MIGNTLGVSKKITGGVGELPTPNLRSDEENFSKAVAVSLFQSLNTFKSLKNREEWETKEIEKYPL